MASPFVLDLLRGADIVIFGYFIALNSSYLVLIALASVGFAKHLRRQSFAGSDDMFRSPLTLPVTVIVPAYNEGAGIVPAVLAMTALRYPRYEVVVVYDGSTDDTFEKLREQFDLVEVPRVVPAEMAYHSDVLAVYVARATPETLTVVRKTNGGKADALNVGINLARHPLICMVDADSLLDPDALLSVAKPFGDDPLRVAACGGVVRIANGCRVVGGRVVDVRMPPSWLVRIQVVEYLRAFLMSRTGWSRLGGLVVISGRIGLVALPYYVIFELLAPFIELGALILLPLGLGAHAIDLSFAWRLVLVAYGYGLLVSLSALFVEEVSFHRYPRWTDILRGVLAAILENFGYRQVLALWQVAGALAAWHGREPVWGTMHRTGFDSTPLETVGAGRRPD